MDKFLEKLLKMIQDDTENLNTPITTKVTELLILKLPTKKSPGPGSFTGVF